MSDPSDPDRFDQPGDQSRAAADAANAHRLLSHIHADVQKLVGADAGPGLEALVADLRADHAEAVARAAERDQRIADRLIDPQELARHAHAGAVQGTRDALEAAAGTLSRQMVDDARDRAALLDQLKTDHADRRAHDARRRKADRLRMIALAVFALLIPAAFALGHQLGRRDGDTAGYARGRDEVAAASWANTPNGKLARRIDRASEQTLPAIVECPRDHGWRVQKRASTRYCFPTNQDRQPVTGWPIP